MVMSIDDPRLVESFRAGENEAFEALVRAHRPALYRHALRRLTDHASAEDAVQETFARAYRSRARVGDDWRLSAWLHQIMANVCIDEANRRRREVDKAGRWATTDMPSRGITPDLDLQLGLDADHSDVAEALRLLPSQYQEALSLRYVAELEYDEMAAVLEVSEENARARVSRASKAMRLLLRPVAAFIAFMMATLFRRGDRAVKAMAIGDSTTAANAATTASHTSTFAANFAPLVETAQTIAVQAPNALPTLGKAAIGIGMLVAVTAPVTAPVVINRVTSDSDESAETTDTDTSSDVGAPVVVDDPAAGSTGDDETVVAEGDESSEIATSGETSEGAVAEIGSQSAAALGVDEAPADETTLPPLVASNPDLDGGSLSVDSLTLTASGPRFDLAGTASIVLGDATLSGNLTGRISLMTDPAPDGRQRIDGVLTLTTADGPVEIRLAGYATATDGTYAMSGVFRATTDLPLVDSGSFSGSFGSSLRLSLND